MPGFYATIARFYDAENQDKTDDLLLYSQLADDYGGLLLDIGCGTGRVMLHLAQEGHTVHGIDNERAMLERAERKRDSLPHLADRLIFHDGDVLTYQLDTAFKLVLLPYNALMHFHTQEAQLALLQRCRQWVTDDGLVVIDVPNAGETFAGQDSDAITLERTFVEPETGHFVLQQAVSTLDRVQQMMEITWLYDEIDGDGMVRRTVSAIRFRYVFFAELRLLLERTGFVVEAVYGDADRSPFEDGCPRMIVLARPVS